MEAARTSETLVNFYQTTRCYNPEDSNLHTHRRENLKSYYLWSSLRRRLSSGLLRRDNHLYTRHRENPESREFKKLMTSSLL
jgi:hypothetical protein